MPLQSIPYFPHYHQLASFYQKVDDTERAFDLQLQNTIQQIDKDSAQLPDALKTGKAIVATQQKLPVSSATGLSVPGIN